MDHPRVMGPHKDIHPKVIHLKVIHRDRPQDLRPPVIQDIPHASD
jgi:hypothetical protein